MNSETDVQNNPLKDSDISKRITGITNGIAKQLQKSQPWVYFLAVTGFITSIISFTVMIGAFKVSIFLASSRIIIAILQFFAALYLLKYARSISTILKTGLANDLEAGLTLQTKLWIVMGVQILITIISMILNLIGMR